MKIKITQSVSKQVCEALAPLLPRYVEVLRVRWRAPLGLTLTLEETVPPQTQSQRGYFHACLPVICEQLEGVTPEDLKLFIKRETWGMQYAQTKMGEIPVIRSSANANRDEYSELIETMHRLCAENGYHCPEPTYRNAA